MTDYLGQYGDNTMPETCYIHHQMSRGGTRPSFHGMERIAVRIGVLGGPCFRLFESDGIDDKRIAVPTADFFTEVSGIGIRGVLAPVDGNHAKRSVLIEEHRVGSVLH